MSAALLPCPFCGDKADIEESDDDCWKHVYCTGCFAKSLFIPDHEPDDEIVAAWNHRVSVEVASADIKPGRDRLDDENSIVGDDGISRFCSEALIYAYELEVKELRAALAVARDVIIVVRQYPDFDGENAFGQMMDEVISGRTPSLLKAIESLAAGRMPETVPIDTQHSCSWRQCQDESGAWDTGCGECYILMDGGPTENSIKYCHGCGKSVAASHETTVEKKCRTTSRPRRTSAPRSTQP